MYKDIREYVQALDDAGELKRISGDVKLDCSRKTGELDAISTHLLDTGGPALMIDGKCLEPYNTPDIPVRQTDRHDRR